jgi:hypothetical protein
MKLTEEFICCNRLLLSFGFCSNVMGDVEMLLGKGGELPLETGNTILGCSGKLALRFKNDH